VTPGEKSRFPHELRISKGRHEGIHHPQTQK
jgi:hypothetical protein